MATPTTNIAKSAGATASNTGKTAAADLKYYLNVGDGFNLLVATGYKLVIQSVSGGEGVSGLNKS